MKSASFLRNAILVVGGIALFACAGSSYAADEKGQSEKGEAVEKKADYYGLDVCPISGGKLGAMGKSVVRFYDVGEGEKREVRFCCPHCIGDFEADLKGSFAKMDSLIVARQKEGYPLNACLVSGEELGGMGPAVDRVYDNQLVRLCCTNCIESFEEKPEKYMEKLHVAYAAKVGKKSEGQKMGEGDAGHGEHHGH